jgi:tRNA threonylcarbamoyladenosine modification (KEOPS) complex  Pcc1 subunit
MYEAIIKLKDTDLIKVLEAEDTLNNVRSTTIITKKEIKIKSKDIIAFKATLNGIIKVIETYEKTSSILK